MAGHKPHIHLVKGLLGLPLWVCRMPGTIDGGGRDPQSAYRSWTHFNRPRVYQEPSMVTISSRAATRSAMPKEEVGLIIAVALVMVPLIGKFLGWW